MNSKHKGNIALAQAVAYLSSQGHYVFLPVGDNGGHIDLIASPDGSHTQRVQCKYTQKRHHATTQYGCAYPVWQVELRQLKSRVLEVVYDFKSFDILFVTTPSGNFLIPWNQFCAEIGKVPATLCLGKKTQKYKIQDSSEHREFDAQVVVSL